MTERMNLNMEDLEMVNGGTSDETGALGLILIMKGYSNYVTIPVDLDRLKDFCASKGYTFVPSEKEENIFIDQEGNTYNTYEIVRKIKF